MRLLGGWTELLAQPTGPPPARVDAIRLDLRAASASVRSVQGTEFMDLVRGLRATPISALALATPACTSSNARLSAPTAVAVAALSTDGSIGAWFVDLAEDGASDALAALCETRAPLVVHDAKAALLGMWGLGIEPRVHVLYDTRLAAACLHLGENHPRASVKGSISSPAEAMVREKQLRAQRESMLSLEGQCARHDVPLSFPSADATASSSVAARALAARAIWTLQLYAAQQPDVTRAGLAAHLYTVEFPYCIANARIEWRGVHADQERLEAMRAGCSRAAERCAEVLKLHCVVPPGSELAFRDCMRRCDLERHLPTLEDSVLKKMEPLHPAARPFRLHRRYARLAGERWQVDEDGRVHPEHVQLGAATGRNACRSPNVVGIGRVLRPVVTAPPGRALIELDYGQIEIGIAGAEHGDQDLIRAYNDGDVYAVVAQHVFADELTEEERTLDPVAFREKRPGLRDAAKPLVLSILYGAGAASVAARMGVSKVQAQSHVDGFFALFPRLRDGLDEHEASGVMRGYAEIVSGLRRNTAVGAPDGWTRRMLRNTPVQGGGAVLFKKALVDMDRQFQGTDTWIVLPLHDGVLIECPVGEVDAVAAKAQRVMENAVRSYYPQLCPRVQVNKARPECWNKDGHADSLERFLVDPDYRLDGGRRA